MEIELTLPEDRPTRRDLPTLLRGLGAVVVALSLSAFLFQGWAPGDDLQRYLMLLGQTAALAALGVGCGRLLRETKGARTFLSLALLAVPINFAILGALSYSLQGVSLALPEMVTWRAAEPAALYGVAGVALPLLAAVGLFALRVLSRRSAPRLGALLFALNALLLIPTRDPAWIGGLLLAATAAALPGAGRLGRDDPARHTLEGAFARAMLFVPALILAGRSLWLHQADVLLITAGATSLYLILRAASLELPAGSHWRRLLEPLSIGPAAVAAFGATELLDQLIPLGDELQWIPALTLFAGLLFELSTRTLNGAPYRTAAALALGGGLSLNLLLFGAPLNALIALCAGIAILAYGAATRRRGPFVVGGLTTGIALIDLILRVTTLFEIGTWGGLALLGAAAIVAGSLIERHGARLRADAGQWRERLGKWEP